ncbi:MAG: DUF4433 domain-containing protein [Flavobacteriaceae bacterium]|nr:DUF4433 domain-containing protein [Flavobacteriaceae bacterium]
MTHIENIPHILEHGITHASSEKANPNYEPIGDSSIITSRNSKPVEVMRKMIGDFIPFYFSYRTRMLFVIQYGLNGVKKVSPDKIVYCVSTVQQVIDSGNRFIFSNGHGSSYLTEFFKSSQVESIDKIVDFKAVANKNWVDEYDTDLKRRKEAEFLVLGDLAPDFISGFVTYDEFGKNKLIEWGVPQNRVVFREDFYF